MELEFARVRAPVFEPYTLFRVGPMAGRFVMSQRRDTDPERVPQSGRQKRERLIFRFRRLHGVRLWGCGWRDNSFPAWESTRGSGRGHGFRVYNFACPYDATVQERIRSNNCWSKVMHPVWPSL